MAAAPALAGLSTNLTLYPPFNGTTGWPTPQPPAGPVFYDTNLDVYCPSYLTTIDLRSSPTQTVDQVSRIWVPKFQYWQCAFSFLIMWDGNWPQYYDGGYWPALFTSESESAPIPETCGNFYNIVSNPASDLATPSFTGGGLVGWGGCALLNDYKSPYGLPYGTPFNTYCPGAKGNGCWSYVGPTCGGLSIYAVFSTYCTSKRVGTVYGVKNISLSCNPLGLTIDLDDVVRGLDPNATVCRDLSGNVVFIASDPSKWGGLPHGYICPYGNWVLFGPDPNPNTATLPNTPAALSSGFADILAEAAAFNVYTPEQLKAMIRAKTIELMVSLGPQDLNGVWGIAIPQDLADSCQTLQFTVSDINIGFCPPPNCLTCPRTNSDGGLSFNGTATGDCPPDGGLGNGGPGTTANTIELTWATDTSKYAGTTLLTDMSSLQTMLPASIPPTGSLYLTNVYVPDGYAAVDVYLFATNINTGEGVIRQLSLTINSNAPAVIANLASAVNTDTNGNAVVSFTFDIQSQAAARIPYRILQGNIIQEGTVTGPTNGVTLTFVTDHSGEVDLLLMNPCGFPPFSSTNVVLPGAIAPTIQLLSLYPDPLNPRELINDDAAGTVLYRITNPSPGNQTVFYTCYNADPLAGEPGTPFSGSFTNAELDITNNYRNTEMTAWAVQSLSTLKSAGVSRTARLHVETPVLQLPPVLNNALTLTITNLGLNRRAIVGEQIALTASQGINGFATMGYRTDVPGTIQTDLDGNNLEPVGQTGYWTNQLANVAFPNGWYAGGNLIDPPVLPDGFYSASSRFDVAAIQPVLSISNGLATIQVSTATTNATLALERYSQGGWTARQIVSGNSGTFSNVNLGFVQRITATKLHYNSAYYDLAEVPYLNVQEDACNGGMVYVTVNPAVTNVAITGTGFATNLPATNLTQDANEMLHFPALHMTNGFYTFTATGNGDATAQSLAVAGNFSYALQLTNSAGVNFIAGVNPTNSLPMYILDVSQAGNPDLILSSPDNPTLSFSTNQPANVLFVNPFEVQIDVSGYTSSTDFTVDLNIINAPSCNITLPLSVVVRRGGSGFDIPVSQPQTGDCLKLTNPQAPGAIPKWQ